ncbi:hypothetical protein J7J90_04815 [Candidatus Micrarchaeota archaeon]|nr:hypothetical protein [Candidatus Micrarchaeota archaeon]
MVKKKDKPEVKSSKKEDDNPVLLLIGYIFGLIALILYIIKKDTLKEFSKYHLVQAIALWLISFVMVLTFILIPVAFIVWLYSIYLGYQVYTGKDPRPLKNYISNFAK